MAGLMMSRTCRAYVKPVTKKKAKQNLSEDDGVGRVESLRLSAGNRLFNPKFMEMENYPPGV
jgi:hypothetical protein